MNIAAIVKELDQEIARLEQAKAILAGPAKPEPGRVMKNTTTSTPAKKRTMSAAGRARIAAAQKARWAKAKQA